MTTDQHCAHPGCTCRVPPGQEYCSAFCREADEEHKAHVTGPKAGGCGCGHRNCGQTPS
jgi:hypothetical protein